MTNQVLIDIFAKIGLKDHGENPHQRFPAAAPAYTPAHFAVVHLKSTGPWNLNVIHAHFSCAGTSANDRLVMVNDILKWKLDNASWSFISPAAPHAPDKNGAGNPAEYVNFRPFEFGSPHDIYFFFEHGANTVKFDSEMLVKITDAQGNSIKMSENEAFFGARDVTLEKACADLRSQGTLVLLENHFTKGKGANKKSIAKADNHLQYKLNLVYGINEDATDPSQVISMIIDPDTGNGMGTEP